MKRQQKQKKVWLATELVDWYLKDGQRLRDKVAYKYLMENNPNHPLIQKLIKKYKKEKFLSK